MNKPLYDRDFYAWTQEQADAIRRRSVNELDWENLLEEVESLGNSQKRELASRLTVLIAHVLKWEHQPQECSKSWLRTIKVQQRDIARLLKSNPSLKSAIPAAMIEALEDGRDLAAFETNLLPEDLRRSASLTFDEAISFVAEWIQPRSRTLKTKA